MATERLLWANREGVGLGSMRGLTALVAKSDAEVSKRTFSFAGRVVHSTGPLESVFPGTNDSCVAKIVLECIDS